MIDFPENGITPEFSTEQLQMDVSSINYKYFRFQWSNDGGVTWGRCGYGNRESGAQIFDINVESNSNNNTVVIPNKSILFTNANSEEVVWNGNVATFTHNMNCIPVIAIYDDTFEQVLYGIKVINGNSFSIDFKDKNVIQNSWRMIISYGVAF